MDEQQLHQLSSFQINQNESQYNMQFNESQSVREGASTRRELFNDTYRRQLLNELLILQNKNDEDDDQPISDEVSEDSSYRTSQYNNRSEYYRQKKQNINNQGEVKANGINKLLNFDDSTFLENDDSIDSDSESSMDYKSNDDKHQKEGQFNPHMEDSVYERSQQGNLSKYYSGSLKKNNATNILNLLNDNKFGTSRQDSNLGCNIAGLQDNQGMSDLDVRSGQSAANPLVHMVMSGQMTRKANGMNQVTNFQENSNLHLRFNIPQGNNLSFEKANSQDLVSQKINAGGGTSANHSPTKLKESSNKRGLRDFNQMVNYTRGSGQARQSGLTTTARKKKIQVKNYLSIMYYVKKFTNVLKTISTTYKFRSMNKKHFEIIGDLSSNYRFFKLSQYLEHDEPVWYEQWWYGFKKFFRTLVWNPILEFQCTKFIIEKCYKRIEVIQPESVFKQYWDVFSNIFFVINIFFVPVRISFSFMHVDETQMSLLFFYYLPPILLMFDIILNFNTTFYQHGTSNSNRYDIFYNYLRTSFFMDFLICFTQILSLALNVIELKALILFRYSKVITLLKQIEERLNLNESQTAYLSLFKLIFMIIFIAHICGCSFFLVTQIEIYFGYTQVWLEIEGIEDYTLFQKYITSLYWAVITMITLGYGDIVPSNTTERAFVIVVTMISCGTFAFSINEIGQILLQIGKKANEQRKKINMLMSYMQKRGLSNTQLLMKIRRNFQYLLDQNAENNEEGVKFLQQLDLSLKNEVMRDIYGKILSNKKIFQLNFSKQMIDQLCLKMKEQTYGPEDIIIKEKDAVKQIFFVLQGEAQSYINLTSKHKKSQTRSSTDNMISILNTFTKGDIFGEKAFFGNHLSEYGVKARTRLTVAFLSLDDFIECLKEQQEDFENFCFLRDKLQFYNITRGLGIKCFGCNKFTHTIISCPHSKYIPNYEKILYLNNVEVFQERETFSRKKQISKNTLIINDVVHSQGVKIIMEYQGIEVLQQLFEELEKAQMPFITSMNNLKYYDPQQTQQMNREQTQQQLNAQSQIDFLNLNTPGGFVTSPVARQQRQTLNSKEEFLGLEQSQGQLQNSKNNQQNNEVRNRELSIIQDEQEKSSINNGVSDLDDFQIRERLGSFQTYRDQLQKLQNLKKFEQDILKPEQQSFYIAQLQKQIPSLKRVDSQDNTDQQSNASNIASFQDPNINSNLTPQSSNHRSQGNIFTYMKQAGTSQFSQFIQNQDTPPSNHRNNIQGSVAPNTHFFPSNFKQAMQREVGQFDKDKQSNLLAKSIKNYLCDDIFGDNDNNQQKKRLSMSNNSNYNIISPELNSIDNQKSLGNLRIKETPGQINNLRANKYLQALNQNWVSKVKDTQKDNFLIFENFDIAKQYQIYFPHNNQTKVILHYTQFVMKTLQKPTQVLNSSNNKDDIQKMIRSYQGTLQRSPKKRHQTILDKKSIFTMYKSEACLSKNNLNDLTPQSSLKNLDQAPNYKFQSTLNHVPIVGGEQRDKSDSKITFIKQKKFNMLENNSYILKEVLLELNKKSKQILQQTDEHLQKNYSVFSANNIFSNSNLQDQNYEIKH